MSAETCYYVDGVAGVDTNSGSVSAPVKTIRQGLSLASIKNRQSFPTKVIVKSGTYRESNGFSFTNQTPSLLVLTAEYPGTVTVSGSDIWSTGWSPDAGNSAIYNHTWSRTDGICPIPSTWVGAVVMPEISRRRELIFMNGRKLTQVLNKAQMTPGSFYVQQGSQVSIWPFAGVNIATAKVEVSQRNKLLDFNGKKFAMAVGMNFEHSSGCVQGDTAINISNAENITLDQVHVRQNTNGASIASSKNITITNSTFNHNGMIGLGGLWAYNVNVSNVETSYNNWRGASGSLYGWDPAGIKFLLIWGGSFTNIRANYNLAKGFWLDTDNRNIAVDSSNFSNNDEKNLFFEANLGPISFTNNKVCNGAHGGLLAGVTSNLTMRGNLFYNNANYQLQVGGDPAGRHVVALDKTTYTSYSKNHTYSQNTFYGVGSQKLIWAGLATSTGDWSRWQSTLSSSFNEFYKAAPSSTDFRIINDQNADFTGWKNATGQDVNSTWQNPGVLCSAPVADGPDFRILNSGAAKVVVTRGGSASLPVTIKSLGGYSGNIALKVDGLSQIGASGSLSIPSIATQGSSNLSILTSSSTQAGIHEVTVYAYDGIDRLRSVTFTLEVR